MKHIWIIVVAGLMIFFGWLVFRDESGQGGMDRLFDNHVTQERLESQRRTGGRDVAEKLVPPHVQAVGIPAPGMTGEVLFPRPGGGYLETGKRAGSFGDTVPVELSAVLPVNELTKRGEIVYTRHCASCHGADGQGKGAVALYQGYPAILPFDDPKFARYPLGKIFSSTALGQGNMPALGTMLTVDEMWQAALWVRHLYSAPGLLRAAVPLPGAGDASPTGGDGMKGGQQ